MEFNGRRVFALTYCLVGLLLFAGFIIDRTLVGYIKIDMAVPSVLIAALVVSSMFFYEWYGFVAGLICGMAMDGVVAFTSFMNTFLLMAICFCAGLVAHYVFNRNFKACMVLTFLSCAVYYFVRWMCVIAFSSEMFKWQYLAQVSFPHALYTTAVGIPMYFLFKWVSGSNKGAVNGR